MGHLLLVVLPGLKKLEESPALENQSPAAMCAAMGSPQDGKTERMKRRERGMAGLGQSFEVGQ